MWFTEDVSTPLDQHGSGIVLLLKCTYKNVRTVKRVEKERTFLFGYVRKIAKSDY